MIITFVLFKDKINMLKDFLTIKALLSYNTRVINKHAFTTNCHIPEILTFAKSSERMIRNAGKEERGTLICM